ncbi:hypothetical protein [uncultured Algibacter sp.]|uniref:hypothetical protein n=1 Tax=uncultured Algibacter sp. TaxID=298659 RepID=UPI00260B6C39|nr:hypothetical protein [uncultured Algibacter sp.]
MRRVLLVFASLLIGLTTASATELSSHNSKIKFEKKKKNYRFAQPIIFMERGIEFLIFPDGSFDFNTKTNNNYDDDIYYRRNSRRSNVNVSNRGPNSNIQYTLNRYTNRGVSISRDRDGAVRRIGNVYLNYDRRGRLTRVGSIFMRYDRGRHSDLSQVGGLKVHFNKWGEIVKTRGQINRFNRDCDFRNTRKNMYGYQNNYNNDWHSNDGVYDDNYYYFKQNGKVKKHKKNKK